jgi:hypothetical protein
MPGSVTHERATQRDDADQDHREKQDHREEQASLEKLAAELSARGLRATVHELPGELPCLDVHNPQASALSERIYAHAGGFWWSWAERMAGVNDVATAAGMLARVLRTVTE